MNVIRKHNFICRLVLAVALLVMAGTRVQAHMTYGDYQQHPTQSSVTVLYANDPINGTGCGDHRSQLLFPYIVSETAGGSGNATDPGNGTGCGDYHKQAATTSETLPNVKGGGETGCGDYQKQLVRPAAIVPVTADEGPETGCGD